MNLDTGQASSLASVDAAIDLALAPVGLGLLATVVLGASAAAWTGRWRAWARRPIGGTLPLHLLPGLGLVPAVGAVLAVTGLEEGDPLADALLGFALLVLVVGMVVWLTGIWWREPRWAQPRWLRDADRSPDVQGDEVAALLHLAASRGADHSSRAEAAGAFAGREPLERWSASRVIDAGATRVDHALGAAGAIDGTLLVYDDGLAFHASSVEERMREHEYTLVLSAADLRATWTVPAGADAQGVVPDAGFAARSRRSPYRRLVLATDDGATVFQVVPAVRRADDLAVRFALQRGPDLDRRPDRA